VKDTGKKTNLNADAATCFFAVETSAVSYSVDDYSLRNGDGETNRDRKLLAIRDQLAICLGIVSHNSAQRN
jgi:hypothetical protein